MRVRILEDHEMQKKNYNIDIDMVARLKISCYQFIRETQYQNQLGHLEGNIFNVITMCIECGDKFIAEENDERITKTKNNMDLLLEGKVMSEYGKGFLRQFNKCCECDKNLIIYDISDDNDIVALKINFV